MKNVKPLRAVFTAAFALTRHGWRLVNALGGVFAPRKLLRLGLAGTLILSACSNPTGDSGSGGQKGRLSSFTGTIAISPAENLMIGTPLGAVYSGSETEISYQWNRDGTAVPGAAGASFTPQRAGSYTVTLSKTNYRSITSAAVTAINAVNVRYETLAADLARLDAGSPENPTAIVFDAISITEDEILVPGAIGWGGINAIIKEAGKYVALDLSACAFVSNFPMCGVSDPNAVPTGNVINVIMDNQYLKGVNLPSSVTVLEYATFNRCSNLTRVSGAGARLIGLIAFGGCTALAKADFPQAAIIDGVAFHGCTALASANFPQATTIGNRAFAGCASLGTIALGAVAPKVASDLFQGIAGNPTITVKIPRGATGYTREWIDGFRGKGWNGSAFADENADMPVTIVIEEL